MKAIICVLGLATMLAAGAASANDKVKFTSKFDMKGQFSATSKAEGANSVSDLQIGSADITGNDTNMKLKVDTKFDLKGNAKAVAHATNGGTAKLKIGSLTANLK